MRYCSKMESTYACDCVKLIDLPVTRKQNRVPKYQRTEHAPIGPHISTVRGIAVAEQQFRCHVLSRPRDTVLISYTKTKQEGNIYECQRFSPCKHHQIFPSANVTKINGRDK